MQIVGKKPLNESKLQLLRRRRFSDCSIESDGKKVISSVPILGLRGSKRKPRACLSAFSGSSIKGVCVSPKMKFLLKELDLNYTWLISLLIIIFVYTCYFFSGNQTESNPLHMWIAVSYRIGDTNMYGKGVKDLCFVTFYMIFFAFSRKFMVDIIIYPMAARSGITSKHKIKRITEQAYSLFYYGISGPFGLYIMYGTDLWLFKTAPMYKSFPDLTIEYLHKIFYLLQAAFWAQQALILALQIEKPRKDFKELVFHHILTLALISLSYIFHFTKMGLAIYITMDVSDFTLATSKLLNYFDSVFTPPFFIIFTVSWIYLRHYINLKILWSVLTEFRTVGDYTLNFATEQYKSWLSLPVVFTLIASLQLVNLYWLFLILRILYRIFFQGIVKDVRSDSESDSDENNSDVKNTQNKNF